MALPAYSIKALFLPARARIGRQVAQLALSLFLGGFFTAAQGTFFSGRDLQAPLQSIREGQTLTPGQMQALGYVQGVYDAQAGLLFCSQAGVDAGQVVKTANAYLLNHPGILEQPASVGLTAAFISQWPCRRANN